MIKEVIPAGEAQVSLQRRVGELLNELKDIFQGIYLIKDLSPKTSDTIVSYGERLSSIIAAQLTGAEWFDSRRFIKTEKKHSKHVLDTELTTSLVRETFKDMPRRVLVPGFISTDKITGEVTNLGRRRFRLYGCHHSCGAGCRCTGNLDGCGRFHDRRSACDFHGLYH